MSARSLLLGAVLSACVPVEPIERPADPAASAAPVGRRTVVTQDLTFELFYPAAQAAAQADRADAALAEWVSDEVAAALDGVPLPTLAVDAVVDAEPRNTEEPWPIVLFSHGLSGFRLQSVDLAVHLASRGYLVAAPDHPGRLISDFLPCLFSPPLEGCDLLGSFGEDPGPEDLALTLDWLERAQEGDGFLAGRLDVERVAVSGHSAGGGSSGRLVDADERIDAVLALAGAPEQARAVPSLYVAGACDRVLTPARTREAWEAAPAGTGLAVLPGAGHMAFTDLCELDLVGLADTWLAPRDDVSEVLLEQLRTLAADGCADQPVPPPEDPECAAWADTDQTHPAIRHLATAFLDEALLGLAPIPLAEAPIEAR